MSEEAEDQARPTRLKRMTGGIKALYNGSFWRHVATTVFSVLVTALPTAAAVGFIWANLTRDIQGHDSALKDHSGELERIKSRIWPIERALADGSGAMTVRTQGEDIKDIKSFVANQRELNGALQAQSQATAQSVAEVKGQVSSLQSSVNNLVGDVKAVLRNLRGNSEP